MKNYWDKIKSVLLSNRFKAFYWHVGITTAVFFCSAVAESIGVLDLPVWANVLIANFIAQVTKYLNTKADTLPALEEQV